MVSPKHLQIKTINTLVSAKRLGTGDVMLNGFPLIVPTELYSVDLLHVAGFSLCLQKYGIYIIGTLYKKIKMAKTPVKNFINFIKKLITFERYLP